MPITINPDLAAAENLYEPQVGDNVVDVLWKHDAQYRTLQSAHENTVRQVNGK